MPPARSRTASAAWRTRRREPLIAPSQGIHLVFDRSFLPGESARSWCRTRATAACMFAIPWHGHTLVGHHRHADRRAIARAAPRWRARSNSSSKRPRSYLHKPPTRADVLSVFAGIRPLVQGRGQRLTAALSRDHTIHIDASGLLTTTGGKWTTYRHMAEDAVDQAIEFGRLPERKCVTRRLRIHGFQQPGASRGSGSVRRRWRRDPRARSGRSVAGRRARL